jgi:hypothetical protein
MVTRKGKFKVVFVETRAFQNIVVVDNGTCSTAVLFFQPFERYLEPVENAAYGNIE